jgi:leucyl/phenylalanyl-tRNA--protein transferase
VILQQLGGDATSPFPAADQALTDPDGLLAWGGDLNPERLRIAYRHGIFPWYSDEQPILWWSPDPRCVLYPDQLHVSRRLMRRMRGGQHRFTADTAFSRVIEACAEPRQKQDGTWITVEMSRAYIRLHELGSAHSVELWDAMELVGGIYGLAIGKVFFGESMFSHQTDASKLCLAALCWQLQQWGFALIDCQVTNPHLLSLGAGEINRSDFLQLLDQHCETGGQAGNWSGVFSFDPTAIR